jgi:hypothetical protein
VKLVIARDNLLNCTRIRIFLESDEVLQQLQEA